MDTLKYLIPHINYMPEKKDYRAIKVKKDTYESLQELKKVIVQKGLNSLSDNIIDYTLKYCPECGTVMDSVEISLKYQNCPSCSFKYPRFKLGLGGSLALGTLIGLGIAGLIYLFTKDDNE
jgi:hypothetical protein